MDLPANPTADQLHQIQQYLDHHKKLSAGRHGTRNYYQEKTEVVGKKVIIFKHSQKKNDFWYMRMYVGDRKYKQVSLNVTDKGTATQLALDHWRKIQNQIDAGEAVFQRTVGQLLDEYDRHLSLMVETNQYKEHTVSGKRTSLKKLRLLLDDYYHKNVSEIPRKVFADYISWRRTKNWDKNLHKRNSTPPSDATCNKELADFKGFFDHYEIPGIDYPFIKINWKLSEENNPSFDFNDWWNLVMYTRSWVRKTHTPNGNERKWNFYRVVLVELLKVLANSGLRPSEALMLRWRDVQIKRKTVENKETGKQNHKWGAVIQVSPDTKTGRREVICPAGVFFKRLNEHYTSHGYTCNKDDLIFRNIGTKNSRADHHVGQALTLSFLRKLWYELLKDFEVDKGYPLSHNYTIYSARSFFINQRLELGIPPTIVGELVGHTIKTMELHYKKIAIRKMEPELLMVNRRRLEESEFETWDLDQPALDQR